MLWALFAITLLVFLGLDLFFHRKAKEITPLSATLWSMLWIGLALFFGVMVFLNRGEEASFIFYTGYFVEKALSLDNLFIFIFLFDYFKTPHSIRHKVLFWGVIGAIVFRAIFIGAGLFLLQAFHWLLYLLAAFLIVMSLQILLDKDKEPHPEKNWVIKLLKKWIPTTSDYVGARFFIRHQKKLLATPLFIALLAIESTDILFALDSIPVILGITQDPFLVYTSNIFALLGLRSLYFLLSHLMQLFHLLEYGLAIILFLIGVKMFLSEVIEIPIEITMGMTLGIIAFSILLSFVFKKRKL